MWDSTQGPSTDRDTLARVLDLPPEHVRVISEQNAVHHATGRRIRDLPTLRPAAEPGRAGPAPGDAGLLRSLGRLGSLGALRPVQGAVLS